MLPLLPSYSDGAAHSSCTRLLCLSGNIFEHVNSTSQGREARTMFLESRFSLRPPVKTKDLPQIPLPPLRARQRSRGRWSDARQEQ